MTIFNSADEIDYCGFNLFELLDSKYSVGRICIDPTFSRNRKKQVERTKANIYLYGYSKDTLPKVIGELLEMDLVFIDGGHSIETIENNWRDAQKVTRDRTVDIFDDGIGTMQVVRELLKILTNGCSSLKFFQSKINSIRIVEY